MVAADGAHATRACHAAIAARGADAVIAPRRNGTPWNERTAGAQTRHGTLRASRRLGRAIGRPWSGHHRRRLVEARTRRFKPLGERVPSRDFDRQTAEPRSRAAIPHRSTALATPDTQRAGQRRPGQEHAPTPRPLAQQSPMALSLRAPRVRVHTS